MKSMYMATRATMGVITAALLTGCGASYQARSVELKEATLVNPALLKKGGEGQALYRYVKPKIDLKKYTSILVDPVLVRKDHELDKEEQENYQKLANNAYTYLITEMEKEFTLVKSPEPGAARIQVAISDIDTSSPVRLVTSSILPIGMAASLVQYSATGEQSAVGEITMEMRVTDATSGELLGAALDRRVGGKSWAGVTNKWYNADEALKYWAEWTRYVFCTMRGGTKCVKPDSD